MGTSHAAAYAEGFAVGAAYAAGVAAGQAAAVRPAGAPVSSAPEGQPLPSVPAVVAAKPSRRSGARERPTCRWFLRGSCKFGESCRYRHTLAAPALHVDPGGSLDSASAPLTEEVTAEHDEACGTDEVEDDVDDIAALVNPSCLVVWCDPRAFKEDSADLRRRLEAAAGQGGAVKVYKTAEKSIRLLQKKRYLDGAADRPPCVFVVAWENAPVLVEYISRATGALAKAVVLCDMCRSRRCHAAQRWARRYPVVSHVAATWEEAVDAVARAVAELGCMPP